MLVNREQAREVKQMNSDHNPPTMPRMVVAVVIGLIVFEVLAALYQVVAGFFLSAF